MLVTTHNLVKRGRDLVQVGLLEPRMEGQRKRPLERPVGAGELALVAVGAEPLERIRPDLRLDPLLPELREHLVAPVDLDDVGLPAVDVALVGARKQQREVARRSSYAAASRTRAARSSSSRRSCGMPTAQRMSERR